MKKRIFSLLAIVLCFSFCLAGCSLFPENEEYIQNDIVAEVGDITITREEFVKGYNSYYSTFYQNTNGDKNKALNSLVKYLISKKMYISDAKKLLEDETIFFTNTEKNYLWYLAYNSLLTNIESFEKKVKVDLGLIEPEEDDDERKQESNFVYTPYDKTAKIVFNEETNQYEIVKVRTILIKKLDEDEKETYEYVSVEEAGDYNDSEVVLYTIEYVINKIEEDKLFSGEVSLTEEDQQNKIITKEAIRRYIQQLKTNEEGKNLSTDENEIFAREINRIYNILYENLLINKLYESKTDSIQIEEEDVLNLYLTKVKECYDRYEIDSSTFIEELTKTIGNAKLYGSYSQESNCIENALYVPQGLDESFFFVTHIVISLSSEQIQKINELKQYCEANGMSDNYYETEFNKIVPEITTDITNAIINLKFQLENEEITQEQYDQQLLATIGSKLMMVDERDAEGYVTEEVMTVQEMTAFLNKDLDEIYIKYYGQQGVSITLNGHVYTPTENGLIEAERIGNNNGLVKEQLQIDYQNERADKFNEYVYKYSGDSGTIQIQKTYFGGTNENWYLYAMGTGSTDNNFVKNFVDVSRELNSNGEITAIKTFLMENWETKDGVSTLKEQSTAFSTMMYCGKIQNLFECFDEEKFTLQDLLDEETAKYYSLLKMDQYRLGLTMNKTLFDFIFEEYYNSLYNNLITLYEDEIMEGKDIVIHEDKISDLI